MKKKNPLSRLGVAGSAFFSLHSLPGLIFILLNLLFIALLVTLYLYYKTKELRKLSGQQDEEYDSHRLEEYLSTLDEDKINELLRFRRTGGHTTLIAGALVLLSTFITSPTFAQSTGRSSLLHEPGIIILLILVLIPVIFGITLMAIKVTRMVMQSRRRRFQR